MRTLPAALLLVFLLPVASWATCTGAQLGLCVSLNQSAYQAGQNLSLTAAVTPGGNPPTVDVYVALQLPTGTLLFLQGNGTFTTTWSPLISNWSPTAFSGPVFGYTFGGSEPGGTYIWYAAFTSPRTTDFLWGIAMASFQFTPQSAGLNGTYSLTGAITRSGCGPGQDGTFPTTGQVTLTLDGANLTGTASLSMPLSAGSTTLALAGTASGNTASGTFTETDGSGITGTGLFNVIRVANTLVINGNGSVANTTCFFVIALTGGPL